MRPVVLIGPPGAPTAGVGVLLGQRWGVPCRVTDEEVSRAAGGRDVATILVEDGEGTLRAAQSAAALAALARPDGVVVLGSADVEDDAVRDALRGWAQRGGAVVLLRLEVFAAARRSGLNAAGAVALGATRARWRALFEARAPLYEEVATVAVDVADRDEDALAEAVAAAL